MEPLWSPAGATGGKRWQIGRLRKRLKQAKTVAAGCDRLPETFHGKEGVDVALARPSDVQVRCKAHENPAPPALLAAWATTHPALIPHEAPGCSRRYPPIPATEVAESPALAGNPRLTPLRPEAP
jgi:hypothetical protein